MSVIDKRGSLGGHKSSENKKRFIDRYKSHISDKVKEAVGHNIIKNKNGEIEVEIDPNTLNEPSYEYKQGHGKTDIILPGNQELSKGDKLRRPRIASSKGHSGKTVKINLSASEAVELLFNDMELPDFLKESILNTVSFERKRAGYAKDGARLDVKKTYELSFGRREALKKAGKKAEDIPFIDDVDLRYRNFTFKERPCRHALMFCVMDVSGSLGPKERRIAKQFFILLQLFLTRDYTDVDVIFIRHTDEAWEVPEEVFYGDDLSGGTEVYPALKLVNKIIKERVDLENTNVYMAQVSDGDVTRDDGEKCRTYMNKVLLPKLQYAAYCELMTSFTLWGGGRLYASLYDQYSKIDRSNLGNVQVKTSKDVLPALKKLFNKGVKK